jgi:hypothetical protein
MQVRDPYYSGNGESLKMFICFSGKPTMTSTPIKHGITSLILFTVPYIRVGGATLHQFQNLITSRLAE